MTQRLSAAFGAAALLSVGAFPGAAAQSGERSSLEERIAAAAEDHRLRLDYNGETFAGPAWAFLLEEGRDAQFFMIGEEHGIAENPKLAAALFTELAKDGYSKVAIEVSPPVAFGLDEALRADGLEGLRHLYARPGGEPAFFGMKEEAEFLAAVRKAAPGRAPALWGADYEVASDRVLLRRLEAKRKPPAARDALDALRAASDASWAKYYETGGHPQHIFSFSGEPALVRAVKDAWPNRDDETDWILDTLEETLEINKLWVAGEGWRSNQRRGAFLRDNFIRHWNREKKARRAPRVLAKFGASHVVRGRNMTETFDLGALLPEIAALEGRDTFSLLVLPGAGSMVARFNPTNWTFAPAPAKDGYAGGLEPITQQAYPDSFTMIDLRALRPLLGGGTDAHPELMRIVHGFDALLVMSGSTPSSEFDHPTPPPGAEQD